MRTAHPYFNLTPDMNSTRKINLKTSLGPYPQLAASDFSNAKKNCLQKLPLCQVDVKL